MEIEGNNFQRCVRWLSRCFALPTLLLALTLTSAAVVHAADDASARKVIFVTLNAGESYVINNVSDGTTPAVHVFNNPNALIVSSDKPGEVVLVAAAAGQWAIDVTTADGQALRYKVSVNAIATPFTNPLAPGKNPPALGSPHFGSAADRTVNVGRACEAVSEGVCESSGIDESAKAAHPMGAAFNSSEVLPPVTSSQPSSNGSSRTTSAASPSLAAPAMTSGSSPSASSARAKCAASWRDARLRQYIQNRSCPSPLYRDRR